MLLTSVMVLSFSIVGLPGSSTVGRAAAAVAPGASTPHAAQGRAKKRRPRPQKAKKADKPDKKPKKNDRGFEL